MTSKRAAPSRRSSPPNTVSSILSKLTDPGEVCRQYEADPVGYAENVLRARLTDDQRALLRSVDANRYTAIKASHAIGKTWAAATVANWWFDCHERAICYVTAPTWPQALGLTFKAIRTQRRERALPGDVLETGLIRDPDPARAGSHFIRALNAESGEGFQGEHSAPILVILEEAVGVPRYIWQASAGLMTHPDCRLLAIANPTNEATAFGQACSDPLYEVLSASALDHPNILAELEGKPPPFPDAVRLAWIWEMLARECERVRELTGDAFEFPAGSGAYYLPNSVFQGRVLGEFPSQAAEQVIPKGWLTNLPVKEPEGLPEIGCDPARFGTDRTGICARQGACALLLKELRQLDTVAIVGQLKATAQEVADLCGYKPKEILFHIDVTGGLGAGPADTLAADGYRVNHVNSSNAAREVEVYPNVRSELWFAVRDRARTKDLDLSRLPKEQRDKLIRELATPGYKVNSRGQKVVEPKAETRKRLGASPDLADAFNLAYRVAPPAPAPPAVGGTRNFNNVAYDQARAHILRYGGGSGLP